MKRKETQTPTAEKGLQRPKENSGTMGLGNSKTKKQKRKATESTEPVAQGAVETHSQPRQRPKESRQETIAASAKPLDAARTAPHHEAEEDRVRAIKRAFRRAHKDARILLNGETLLESASAALLKILCDAHPDEVVGALRGLRVMAENYPVEIVGFLRCFVGLIDNAKSPHIGGDRLLLCPEAKTIMNSILASTMRDTAEKLRKLAALSPQIARPYFRPLTLL